MFLCEYIACIIYKKKAINCTNNSLPKKRPRLRPLPPSPPLHRPHRDHPHLPLDLQPPLHASNLLDHDPPHQRRQPSDFRRLLFHSDRFRSDFHRRAPRSHQIHLEQSHDDGDVTSLCFGNFISHVSACGDAEFGLCGHDWRGWGCAEGVFCEWWEIVYD